MVMNYVGYLCSWEHDIMLVAVVDTGIFRSLNYLFLSMVLQELKSLCLAIFVLLAKQHSQFQSTFWSLIDVVDSAIN